MRETSPTGLQPLHHAARSHCYLVSAQYLPTAAALRRGRAWWRKAYLILFFEAGFSAIWCSQASLRGMLDGGVATQCLYRTHAITFLCAAGAGQCSRSAGPWGHKEGLKARNFFVGNFCFVFSLRVCWSGANGCWDSDGMELNRAQNHISHQSLYLH